ncbi:spore coat protein YsxE [Sporolactobacillus kofuensis]|uniref:Spore coat protein YsxE n=1 Tax=Sporolactobacillus kofuensis TaxID=269672 RepID=A0ABW1WDI8_9BACL|nr:spore coat protein YsxE [Sporolactobacillus kofuensis]MCO7175520.1 spore coat protein YsxE [Sporolactobacillus kofuensis]
MGPTVSNQINRILYQYDLYPHHFDDQGNLIKIETYSGTFALKRKALNDQQIRKLQTVYSLARQMTIDAVCPLSSKYGDLIIRTDELCYYLMPWFRETVDASDLLERYRHLFIKAGQLHRQTLEKETECMTLYQDMVRVINQRQMVWEQFLYQAEHHVYPSPFEQMVFKSAAIYLVNMQRARDFFSRDHDDEGKGKLMRRALCHGRLSPLHLLIQEERSALTNFENSEYGFFVVEIATLFEQSSVTLGTKKTDWKGFFRSYEAACPMSDEEHEFLLHFLLFPSAHAELLQRYMQTDQRSEQWFVSRWTKLCRVHQEMFTTIKLEIDEERKKKETIQAEVDKKMKNEDA